LPRSVPAIFRFLDDSLSQLRALTPAAAEQIIAAIEDEAGALPPPLRSTLRIALTTTGLRRVSVLAAAVSITPRAFSRVCTRAHLPAPKHWLLLAHAIQVSAALNRDPVAPFSDLAEVLGYPDEFSLSRALFSTLGCRLRTIRRNPRVSFVIARWLLRHSIALPRRPERQPA
jgi:hypothetical protein